MILDPIVQFCVLGIYLHLLQCHMIQWPLYATNHGYFYLLSVIMAILYMLDIDELMDYSTDGYMRC